MVGITIHLGRSQQKEKNYFIINYQSQIRNNKTENLETFTKHFHSFNGTVLNPNSNFAFPVQKSIVQ